ncbi:MAG: type I toxin-antitoxin system Fst family toxin [Lactobacillaceae bacterium]
MATCPERGGASMIKEILTLVIAPIIVGVVLKLFAYWLDKHNDNQK